jgi:hypothetical protein
MSQAMNAYRLLKEWRIPPGMEPEGGISESAFNKWLDKVKSECKKTGHLEVALIHIGEVLIHSPPDPNGLWIHNTIAKALNARDARKMRDGFHTGFYNSRGAHFVDPTGKPEKELAAKYRQQADEAENHGYHRLAAMLSSLSDEYEREAERVINAHEYDSDDL